jgi:hypothetical protein
MSTELVKVIGGKSIRARESDRYVNATELCKAAGKKWSHYYENKGTKEFIQALEGSTGIPANLLIQSRVNGPNEDRGTWIHPRVVINFAQWASPEFAVAVTAWVLELLQTGKVELQSEKIELPANPTREQIATVVRIIITEEYPKVLAEILSGTNGPHPTGPFWTVESRLEELYWMRFRMIMVRCG